MKPRTLGREMKTEVKIQGQVKGRNHTCILEKDGPPSELFKSGITAQRFFAENTGLQPDGKVTTSITVIKDTCFGIAGFNTDNIEVAVEVGEVFRTASDQELANNAISNLPDPDELMANAVAAYLEGDTETVKTIAGVFSGVGSLVGKPIAFSDFMEIIKALASEVSGG